MKELKFIAWDKKNKKWIAQPLGFSMSVIPYKSFFTHIFAYVDGFADVRQDQIKIMQYTGLKDKKGKEIYFSYIVKYKDDHNQPQIGIVKANDYFGGYIEAIGGDEEGNQDIELHPDYELEVIGNIYENPELLESKQ